MAETARCPGCAGDVSVWAAHCPACGADLPQLPAQPVSVRLPHSGPDSGPPRNRDRRGAVGVVAGLVLVLVAGTLVWRADHRSTSAPPIAVVPPITFPPTGPAPPPTLDAGPTTVVEAGAGGLLHLYALGRPTITVAVPGGGSPTGLISVGDAVVFVSAGEAWTMVNRSYPALHDLGPADRVFAAANPGQVWLVLDRPPAPVTVQLGCVAGTGVSCDGLSAPIDLPAGVTVIGPAGGALLLQPGPGGPGSTPLVWDPMVGNFVHRFPPTFGDVVAAWQNLVAWRETCAPPAPCPVHLTDVTSGADSLLPMPPGGGGYAKGGAFSSDGAYLAAFTVDPADPTAVFPVIVTLGAKPTVESTTLALPVDQRVGNRAVWESAAYVAYLSGPGRPMYLWRADGSAPEPLGSIPAATDFALL